VSDSRSGGGDEMASLVDVIGFDEMRPPGGIPLCEGTVQ